MQQRLKRPRRAARAGVVAAELFGELLVATDDALATFDLCFGWEASTAFAHHFESRRGLGRSVSWHDSLVGERGMDSTIRFERMRACAV